MHRTKRHSLWFKRILMVMAVIMTTGCVVNPIPTPGQASHEKFTGSPNAGESLGADAATSADTTALPQDATSTVHNDSK